MRDAKTQGNALAPGAVIAGKYTVDYVLGVGGFGIAYRCSDAFGGKVAVKEYFRGSLCSRAGRRMDYSDPVAGQVLAGMKAFVNEGKRLLSIAGKHPNIVKVKEIAHDNDTVYIVMEMVEGRGLDALMSDGRKGQPMPEAQAVKAMLPIIDAVAMLHRERITHLDIKPGNIIMAVEGEGARPVLIDFGLSKHYDENGAATTVSAMAGCTPGYAPAEQYAEDVSRFSPQSDVYSLGATLFFLLTGATPPTATAAGSAVIKRLLLKAGVGEAMATVVSKAMSTAREDRQADAGELKRELEHAMEGNAQKNRPRLGWGIRRRLLAIVMAAAFVGMGAIFWFMSAGVDPAHPEEMAEEPESAHIDTTGIGFSTYGDDLYARLQAPGAMINIQALPTEPSVGDSITIEIGVKTAGALEDLDAAREALRPQLRHCRYLGCRVEKRPSGNDSLSIFCYDFKVEGEGTELVEGRAIAVGADSIRYTPQNFHAGEL